MSPPVGDQRRWSAGASARPSAEDARWLSAYDRTHGDVQRARAAWSDIVRVAIDEPAIAVATGAAMASVLVERLGVSPFCVRIVGGEADARARILSIAAATAGAPDVIVTPGDATVIARRAAQASILPLIVADGAQPAAIAAGLATPAAQLTVVTAGEGNWDQAPPGVIEVQVPSRVVVAERLYEGATDHAGWPLAWLAWSPIIEQVGEWFERSLAALRDAAERRGVEARAHAACATGFGVLANLVGAADAGFTGLVAALEVLETDPASGDGGRG